MSRKLVVVSLMFGVGVLLFFWPRHPSKHSSSAHDSSVHDSLSSVPEAGSAALPNQQSARGQQRSSLSAGKGGIQGLVRRQADKHGVGGVELTCLDATRQPPEERVRVKSIASGRFALDLAAGRYQLKVNAKGYDWLDARRPTPGHAHRMLQVMPEARTKALVIKVRRKSVLRGRVLNAAGEGLANVRVGLAGVRRGGVWLKRLPEPEAVKTAANGSFALRVPSGMLRLAMLPLAMAAGKRWTLSPTLLIPAEREVSGLQLTPRADASLSGRVVGPGGARLRDASVLLHNILGQREIRCDGGGRFKLGKLNPGELLLSPRAKGMAPKSISRVHLRSGREARVVLKVQPTQRQRGRVVGVDGKGVGGARVQVRLLTPAGIMRPLIAPTPLHSAADGRFSLQLDARPRSIMAEGPGPLRGYLKGIVPQAGELKVALRPLGEIAGRIRSTGGKPIGFVRLTVEEGGRREQLWLITGKGGRFRLPGLMPGSVRVDVEAESYAGSRAVVALRSGVTTALDFHLQAAGSIIGQIRNTAGSALADAQVLVEGHAAEANTDVDGRFELQGLAPGVHVLQVSSQGHRALRVEKIQVNAGAKKTLSVITLRSISSCSGRPRCEGLPQKRD
ncbi:MAG: carboxypeptidase regulatory-like domain-containing protein [Deltaproteobacteria bacterium]|nr:carboxypeptidase regulatory-like domain-containing protein [Deltaproteobacteria bacterium]